tara:strand:- start:432 stop:725 length:294 start_codon:yes stop_codon:yes gene_type:complete
MKVLKFILGLVAGLSGVIALFAGGKKKQKIKEIKQDIKTSEKKVEKLKEENEQIKQTQKNYKKTLSEMEKKKETYKAPDVDIKEANDFLKKFSKSKK